MSNETGSVMWFVHQIFAGGPENILLKFSVESVKISQTSNENRLNLYDNLVTALKIVIDNSDNWEKSGIDVYMEELNKFIQKESEEK